MVQGVALHMFGTSEPFIAAGMRAREFLFTSPRGWWISRGPVAGAIASRPRHSAWCEMYDYGCARGGHSISGSDYNNSSGYFHLKRNGARNDVTDKVQQARRG